jgi:hypothetical protein
MHHTGNPSGEQEGWHQLKQVQMAFQDLVVKKNSQWR